MSKIYCLGLSRTGTTTFSDFLKLYGLNVIHYPNEMQLMSGAGDGASDIPVVPAYKVLDIMFRGSKFVHLVRDNWVESVEPYFLRKTGRTGQGAAQLNLREMVYGSVLWDKQKYGDAYNRHNDDVRKYFADRPDDFIEMNIIAGDSPKLLLDFLGIEDKGIEFPKSNARENTWKEFKK